MPVPDLCRRDYQLGFCAVTGDIAPIRQPVRSSYEVGRKAVVDCGGYS
jgi:hypothetical protein